MGRCGVRCLVHRTKRHQRTAKSCGPGAATLASIRPACAGTATVTKKAAHRGEHEVSRQTIARGKPGCLGCTCSFYPVCESTRAFYGCIQRPAFPAPSVGARATEIASLGRERAAGTSAHVSPSLRGAKRRSNPWRRKRIRGLLRFARNDEGETIVSFTPPRLPPAGRPAGGAGR